MTHVHKLSGQKLRLLAIRDNGSGLFEDATGRVICDMRLVEPDRESGYHPDRQAVSRSIRGAV